MQTGQRAQGHRVWDKAYVVRHGHAPPRSAQSAEKAIETRVRQQGKKACRQGLKDYEAD